MNEHKEGHKNYIFINIKTRHSMIPLKYLWYTES